MSTSTLYYLIDTLGWKVETFIVAIVLMSVVVGLATKMMRNE